MNRTGELGQFMPRYDKLSKRKEKYVQNYDFHVVFTIGFGGIG